MNQSTDAKRLILEKLRTGKPDALPAPDMPVFIYQSTDLVTDFIRMAESFDARTAHIEGIEAVDSYIKAHFADVNTIYSAVDGVSGNMHLGWELNQPQDAQLVDLSVIAGTFGVAESGSVWVTNEQLGMNSLGLLAKHLIIVLREQNLVGNMHEAYRRAELGRQQYGVFMTGPSATADIEAVHVSGAQGALSLTVLLMP
ncbi:MAG: LUD domain-containing protein [Chromatiales bacterium]|jgi:L-lactate dehydrogenase complex protein LldG